MWSNPQFAADLVTFIEEVLHGKLYSFVQWVQYYELKEAEQGYAEGNLVLNPLVPGVHLEVTHT